jgi:predicted RNase H-like HicB family nuclease
MGSDTFNGRMNPTYEIILYWSEDDQAFVVEVPELPGCIAHGDSQESALANVNEAITLWVATAEGHGVRSCLLPS